MRSELETVRIPAPSQVVAGRWKLLERLGAGGMGLVYLAEQLGVGNKVAIKFLDPEPSPDREIRVQRFLREAKFSLEVVHPGAALLLDTGQDQERGYLFLVFEYVEGLDLRDLLRAEWRLSFEEARTIALRIAEALAHAHGRGVVHRDVKPENVRVRRDLAGPHVKVLDFGIARLIGGKAGVRLTGDGLLAGTPRYMAPEQVRDEEIDARTDVYALGLVFFEMLCGQPAYDGINHAKVMMRQVQEPLPTLASVAPELQHPGVDAFLARACAKQPAQRFQSMAELAAALKALDVARWPKAGERPLEPHLEAPTDPENPVPDTGPQITKSDRPVTQPASEKPRPHKATKMLLILIGGLAALAALLAWQLH